MDARQIEKYRSLGLNIDRTHVGNLELARAGTSLDVIFRISDALEVPVHKLFEFRD